MERSDNRRDDWSTSRILLLLQIVAGLILAGTLTFHVWFAAGIYLLDPSLQVAFGAVVILVCAFGLNFFLDRRQ